MRKQTISKIAAIALAAMTVVPSFGLTASAVITTFDEGTAANGYVKKAWGNVNKAEFQLDGYTQTYYKVVKDDANSTGYYDQYKLEEDTTKRDYVVFSKHDKTATDVPTQTAPTAGESVTPYACVYYTDDRVIPDAYGRDKSGTGPNGTITKSEADTASDYNKAVATLNALNAELKSYGTAVENAKNNVDRIYSFTTHDGKTIYVAKPASASDVKYYNESNALTEKTDYTPLNGNDGLDIADMKLDPMACGLTRIAEGEGFYKFTYSYTHSITTVPLTTAMNDLQLGAYVAKGAQGTLEAPTTDDSGKSNGYLVTRGGETVPTQNPDASTNQGTAGTPSGSTTTPSTRFDYSLSYTPYYNLYSPRLNLYFPTAADALAAGATDYRQVTGPQTTTPTTTYESSVNVSTTYPWYSTVTGRYYKTSADAVAASGGSSSAVYNYYDRYYYNLYGLYGYGYTGLYYPTTTTTTTTDTSNVTIGKYKGWTYVNRYIRSASSGASYTVSMNGETSIPSTVLSALYGKDVTVNFKFNSGAILSINGKNLSSTSSISTDIKYNTKNVPDSLVKKAVKADDGISTAQFTVSGGNMSASASVTIKFKASRAGCTAKLYRYNSSSNSLSLVSTTVIKSNGNGVFDKVSQGGSYLVVLS